MGSKHFPFLSGLLNPHPRDGVIPIETSSPQILTINVPVVFMARYVMMLHGAPLKIITYRAIKTTGTRVLLCSVVVCYCVLLCVVVCCCVLLCVRGLTGLKSPHWLAPWLSWLKRLSGKQMLMRSNLIGAFIPLAPPITLFCGLPSVQTQGSRRA